MTVEDLKALVHVWRPAQGIHLTKEAGDAVFC